MVEALEKLANEALLSDAKQTEERIESLLSSVEDPYRSVELTSLVSELRAHVGELQEAATLRKGINEYAADTTSKTNRTQQ